MKDSQRKSDKIQRRRRWIVGLYEFGLVAAAVGVFFVFLFLLLRFYFPEGTGIESEIDALPPLARSGTDVSYAVGDDVVVDVEFFAARIVDIQRRVQRRRAESLTWNDAAVGEAVQQNDAVQTFARSTALLEVNETNRLTIGQNSLIVFDQQDVDPFLTNRNSVLVMINGELSGTLTADRGTRFNFGITLPNSGVTLVRDNPDEDIDFLITVNEDQSTTVNLYSGSARIIGRDGTAVPVPSNHSATIDSSGSQISILELPIPPRSDSPVNERPRGVQKCAAAGQFCVDTGCRGRSLSHRGCPRR